jgi:hypothetical protein
MIPLNPWVESNVRKLATYFQELIVDPLAATAARPPWHDLDREVHVDDGHLEQIDLGDLFELHRIVYQRSNRLIVAFSADREPADADFLSFVAELGPSPFLIKKRTAVASAISAALTTSSSSPLSTTSSSSSTTASLSSSSSAAAVAGSPAPTASPLAQPSATAITEELIDTSALEAAKFLYSAGTTRDGWPVVYLIVHRLRVEFLQNINVLISYIFKLFEPISNSNAKYALVIDMSWSRITSGTHTSARRC